MTQVKGNENFREKPQNAVTVLSTEFSVRARNGELLLTEYLLSTI